MSASVFCLDSESAIAPAGPMPPEPTPDPSTRNRSPASRVRFECDECGTVSVSRGLVDHYDRFRCVKCGHWYWALWPKRGGPLVVFPWPGDAMMERARREARINAEREAA